MPGSIVLSASTLAARLKPERTVLFLGAGASVASGGLTGQALAIELSQRLANGDVVSRDLTEATTILQNRYGRKALIEQVIVLVRPFIRQAACSLCRSFRGMRSTRRTLT